MAFCNMSKKLNVQLQKLPKNSSDVRGLCICEKSRSARPVSMEYLLELSGKNIFKNHTN